LGDLSFKSISTFFLPINHTYFAGTQSGWWFQTFVIFHFIYGMSSFPLTNIFQDGYCTTNQMILVCQKMGSTPKLRCCCGDSIVENDNQRSWILSGNAWCLIF
jgi:hypothetical protein